MRRSALTHSTVGRSPHLFQLEFLDTSFIGGDRSALDTDVVFFDSFGGIDGDLIVGLRARRIVGKDNVQWQVNKHGRRMK